MRLLPLVVACGRSLQSLRDKCRFPGDDIPIVRGSALCALKGENDKLGKEAILQLMNAVDDYFPTPQRVLDKAFSMPVEDVFSIQGRGTVVTGRVEQGIVKVGDEVEIIGIQSPIKSTVTGALLLGHLIWLSYRLQSAPFIPQHCVQAWRCSKSS